MFHVCALNKYLNLFNKANKCTCVKHVLSHISNHQHVSIATLMNTEIIKTCW